MTAPTVDRVGGWSDVITLDDKGRYSSTRIMSSAPDSGTLLRRLVQSSLVGTRDTVVAVALPDGRIVNVPESLSCHRVASLSTGRCHRHGYRGESNPQCSLHTDHWRALESLA